MVQQLTSLVSWSPCNALSFSLCRRVLTLNAHGLVESVLGDKEPVHSSFIDSLQAAPVFLKMCVCTLISVILVLQVLVITRHIWPQYADVKRLASSQCFEKPRLTTKLPSTFRVLTQGAADKTACNCECNSYVLTHLGT